ncbi:M15 family metallopeptidase [Actinopolymorpha rutila]|uniref:LAS superfamily LD-carboxypeptidase LdcB n=1 Tax=Actinopolymorpha rutila TaxID=446787 RepID=A0A852ZP45_9ACTN|nr:M15 family metallopeptidase [Actinopolymorpha rutila]NYH90276.1 LAS superfamily LD-carboxypeptidase LdcB [Actinopolymorpha rutila]
MEYRTSRPAPPHPAGRVTLVGLAILGVVVAAFLMRRSLVAASVPPRPSITASTASTASASTAPSPSKATGASAEVPRQTGRQTALGEADGVVPDGVALSVFDEDTPAVNRLAPDLLAALRRAATDAGADGIRIRVNSGWRSPAYQTRLLQEAVAEYGSQKEAARWVATATTSAHVSGDAVDVGPFDAVAWLSEHGAAYGLCQIYGNESWHYELRPDAVGDGCPPMYANPTEDPRMRQ